MRGSLRCDQAIGRDAQGESGRRAVRRLRLGDEPEAGGRANQSRHRRRRRTRPGLSIGKQSRLRSHAFADAGRNGGRAAQRPSGPCRATKPNDLLAIDLSSERVRLATWLLDGVRQGQPLGALLGYRFERRLQEAGKPQFISFFRELAPLVARKLEPPIANPQPVEAIAANNVVDGLALPGAWLAALELHAVRNGPKTRFPLGSSRANRKQSCRRPT